MTGYVIIGVVVAVALVALVLLLAAKNNVTVVEAPRPRPPPGGATRSIVGTGPVHDLLREGKLIEAIKKHRELTGLGLKEAKDAVEAMARGEAVPLEAPATSVPASSVQDLLRAGRKIEAIKLYREQSGLGLKEAKDVIEAMESGNGAPPPLHPKRSFTSEMAVDDAELRGHVTDGRLIEAIKRYRELTGLGLKESKDAIESLRDSMKS